ncbi:hypothetical protein TNCV_3242231 [Trichonephila clavipes]|nr:hypothetical protein TNCV_3242231 [Trichonephila clavipes]
MRNSLKLLPPIIPKRKDEQRRKVNLDLEKVEVELNAKAHVKNGSLFARVWELNANEDIWREQYIDKDNLPMLKDMITEVMESWFVQIRLLVVTLTCLHSLEEFWCEILERVRSSICHICHYYWITSSFTRPEIDETWAALNPPPMSLHKLEQRLVSV